MLDPAFDPAGLAGQAAHTLVSWLGTYFVHSTVLIGGVWALGRLVPLDAMTRNLLWKVSLVGGLCTATLQTGLGVEPMFGTVQVAAAAPAAPPAPDLGAPTTSPPLLLPDESTCVGCDTGLMVVRDDEFTVVFAGAPALVEAPMATLPPPLPPPPSPPMAAGSSPYATAAVWLVAGLFMLGAGASLGRLAATFRRLRRTLRDRREVTYGPLRERLTRLLAEVRPPLRPVRLTTSERIASPIALAGREIVVPGRAEELAPRQQEAMLAHELAHVIRRDPAWQMLAAVIEAALFFQPLNRVARRGMQEAAEELCDDWAARHSGSGLHLARCLTEVASWPGRGDMSALASSMAGQRSPLVHRVQRLLDEQVRDRGLWARRWRGLLGAALLAMVVFGAPGLSLSVAEAHEPPRAPEWPTAPDRGPAPAYQMVRIPDLPAVPVVALAPHHEAHGHDVIVVQEPQPLTGRQRRLLRRAERHAKKAAKLREKSGASGQGGAYKAFYVPAAAPAQPVHYQVVHHEDCDHDGGHKIVLPKIVLPKIALPEIEVPDFDGLEATIERELARVDFDKIAADVERQVEHALRGAERAQEHAERARERAEREGRRQAERAQKQATKAQRRAGEAVRREVDRALRDGVIDAEEKRRIGEAARKAAKP